MGDSVEQNNHDRAVWQAARRYLANGWSVFPIAAASDRLTGECRVLSGKLPVSLRYIFNPVTESHQATPAMFKGHGVGIATGRKSGLLVIDVDGDSGFKSAASLRLPPTRTVQTHNGVHLYYTYPDSAHLIPSSPGGLAEGIDVKGDEGFVNAPPSHHPEGGSYQWLDPDAPLAALPADIVSRIQTLNHRSRWKHLRRYVFQKFLRLPFNVLTGI